MDFERLRQDKQELDRECVLNDNLHRRKSASDFSKSSDLTLFLLHSQMSAEV